MIRLANLAAATSLVLWRQARRMNLMMDGCGEG